MSETDDDRLSRIVEHAADIRKFEIDLFWKRSLFFWGFLSAAFIAYGALSSQKADIDIIFAIACFGVICSLVWTLVNRGSKYWYEAWEQKLLDIEAEAFGRELFSRIEPIKERAWWGAARYSVSKLAIALSDFVVLIWLLLAVKASPVVQPGATAWSTVILAVSTLYVVALLVFGRSKKR